MINSPAVRLATPVSQRQSSSAQGDTGLIIDFLVALRARGIEVTVHRNLVGVSAPPGVLDEPTRAELRRLKPELLQFLSAPGTKDVTDQQRDKRQDNTEPSVALAPLTHAQRPLWIQQEMHPASSVYNIPYAFRIEGQLDAQALVDSLSQIVSRHGALRTTFIVQNGIPQQRVDDGLSWQVSLQDMTANPNALDELLQAEARRPFDLAKGPLFRAWLITMAPHTHVLFFNAHHIVFDGTSVEILLDEMVQAYEACVNGRAVALQQLSARYADVGRAEQELATLDRFEDAIAHFRASLADSAEPLELPIDKSRGAVFSFLGSEHRFALQQDLVDAAATLAQRHQATLFMVLLAAFQTLLSRYSRQKHIVVGSPVAGRHDADTEALIGMFVNMIPLPADFSAAPSFVEHLKAVRQTCLAAYEQQALPFDLLVQALAPPPDRSRTPVFQTIFTFVDTRARKLDRCGLRWERLAVNAAGAKTDLTLLLEQHQFGIAGYIEFATDLFVPAMVERLAMNFETLLRSIVAAPETPVNQLSLLHPQEQGALADLNATAAPLPAVGGFYELIKAQAERTPSRAAVIDGNARLTYAELERRSNRIAHYLAGLGVDAGQRVGVAVGRTTNMVCATLGIMKAGALTCRLIRTFRKNGLHLCVRTPHWPGW